VSMSVVIVGVMHSLVHRLLLDAPDRVGRSGARSCLAEPDSRPVK
jgi:hypothetical protein